MKALSEVTIYRDECTLGPDWELFIHCCLAPSILIVLTLSFLGKRYNFRQKSLFGIKQLAVVFPINLLDDHEHRWSHALAFGATASIIFQLFTGKATDLYLSKDEENVETWLKILLGAIATFELGTVLFPFFACITSPSLFVASLLGFSYVAVWFSVLLSSIIMCPGLDQGGFPYESVVLQLPVLIFTFLLMLRYLYYLIKVIMKRIQGTKLSSEERMMKSHQGQHVTALLRPPVPEREYTRRWEQIAYHWYKPSETFIYPTRIICTFVVAVLCQYQVAIRLTYSFDQVINNAALKIREYYAVYVDGYNINATRANETYLAIDRYETAAHVSWYLACALSIGISLSYIGHIFVCYRKHILRLYQGNRRFLPDMHQTSAQNMTGSLQYCGFQIAYYLSGYVIMMVVSFAVMYVISGALVIPLIKDARAVLIGFVNVVLPLLGVAFLVFGSQPILARRVFLQPKINESDKDKPLALQHRDFYHTFSYFLVFLNVLVGMLSCVIRILTGLFVGVFLLCRIDRPILMRGYEHLDKSYQAYVGNLNMINTHSHPVLVVFCQILINKIVGRKKARLGRDTAGTTTDTALSYTFVEHDIGKTKSYSIVGYGSTSNSTSTFGKSISPRARAVMRWQLAYTLLFNPSLLHTRKRSRQITFKEMEKRILKVATLLPHRQQVLQRSQAAAAVKDRVRSGPTLFVKLELENKLAAESLNKELMDDISDYEEEKEVEEEEEEEEGEAAKGVELVGDDEKQEEQMEKDVSEMSRNVRGTNDEKLVPIDLKGDHGDKDNVDNEGNAHSKTTINRNSIGSLHNSAHVGSDNEDAHTDTRVGNGQSDNINEDLTLLSIHDDRDVVIHLDQPQQSIAHSDQTNVDPHIK